MFQSLYIIERDKDFELLIMGKEDFVQNDFLLIRKMKQGDDDALDLFVHKYYQDILNYCHYHCSDKTYAEDLAQETFVHFFLYTIASNLCKDYLKKIKEIPLEENEIVEENQMENILNKILVEQALKQLPVELCEVLTLYYFQELKLTEISDTLQIGLPLVKYRLRKAKIQLEEVLRKEEYDEFGRKNENV